MNSILSLAIVITPIYYSILSTHLSIPSPFKLINVLQSCSHLRSVRKRLLKVRKQQEAVMERIQASKNKYGHIELDFVNLVTVCYCRRPVAEEAIES